MHYLFVPTVSRYSPMSARETSDFLRDYRTHLNMINDLETRSKEHLRRSYLNDLIHRMRLFAVMAALLQIGLCSHVAVKMPYLNPAGVTYVNSLPTQDAAFAYASDTPLHTVETSLQYAAPVIPAKVETHHVGYAAAQVPAVAAVPFVKHVPTVSHVPVTTIEAHPALVQKQLDVVKPAVTSRKIEVSMFRK